MKVHIYTDGGARGNPGPAASGVIIKNEAGKTLAAYGEFLGVQTNNVAEYSALVSALTRAKALGATEAECTLDSELVVKQMQGLYRVREPALQKLFVRVHNLTTQFKKVTFYHIRRHHNTQADREVNRILDAAVTAKNG